MNGIEMEAKDWQGDGVLGKPWYARSEAESVALKTNLFSKPPKTIEEEEPHAPLSCKEHIRNYFFSFLPPHVRRRGLRVPPVKKVADTMTGLLTLPYFPWATMNWRIYPAYLPDDIIAGITVGIMLLPQGMAYAKLASLPPIYGLYASTIAGYVYSIFGTSGQLTIGPVALVSLFMSSTYKSLNISLDDADLYSTWVRCQTAPMISLAVGILLCLLALFRIGSLMKFISPSVLTGFVSGSGVYIFLTQSKMMFGIKLPRAEVQLEELKYLFTHLNDGNKYAMYIGFTSFAALLILKHLSGLAQPHIRRAFNRAKAKNDTVMYWTLQFARLMLTMSTLLVIIIATEVSSYLTKRGAEFDVVGEVPQGFNSFQVPLVKNNFGVAFDKVLLQSIPLMFLTYMESVSVARKYALVNRYTLDMTQELWALGIGCLAASFFKAYPPGGSFSRTALKAEVGVKTPFANIVTSLFVTIILVFATSLLQYVPSAVLGAVICTAVLSLWDFSDMWRALWVAPVDFLVMMFTFCVTVFYNVEKGLLWGIMASVVVFLFQMSRLDIESIGQLRCEEDTPNILRGRGSYPKFRPKTRIYPGVMEHGAVRILRLNANLFFGNISAFRDEFYASLIERDSERTLRAVLVDAQGVPEIDLSSLAVIDEMVEETRKLGVRVIFAGANRRVVNSLESYELLEEVGGPELVSMSVEDVFYIILDELAVAEAEEGTEVGSNGEKDEAAKASEGDLVYHI